MKLQALLIAIAMVAGGSAFAASDAAPTGAKTVKPTAGAPHKAKTTKARHKSAHHPRSSNKGSHHAKASSHHTHHMAGSTHHMGANSRHMGATTATPETDVTARDRQGRIDDAYSKWKANNG